MIAAEEFLKEKGQTWIGADGKTLFADYVTADDLISFAKLHVEEALKQASENAETFIPSHPHLNGTNMVNKDSILNAYPLTNIK